MLHPFYERVDRIFKQKKKNRAEFSRLYNIPETTLSNYWSPDSNLPPGKVLEKLSTYLDESLNYLIFGINISRLNDLIKKLLKLLNGYSERILWQIVGCVRKDLAEILKDEAREKEAHSNA